MKRLRPCHDPSIAEIVHLVYNKCGGKYGFISSHAANSFGLATFLAVFLHKKYRILKGLLFFWALIVSYSRIYLGVHFPGDIITAALLGSLYGFTFGYFYIKYRKNKIPGGERVSA